jgi:hypothetical protein
MAQSAPSRTRKPTKRPQPAPAGASRPARARAGRAARSPVFAGGAGRPATRGDGNPVVELEYGITVYPAREGQDRWRAVWHENGTRRQCEAVSGERLAARLQKVAERLAADAPNMERAGADLIEIAGHLYVEAPKNRKRRQTIYPRLTPAGYPLAERLAARIEQARTEQGSGSNPLGLVFPSPHGKHWRSSNFNRNVLKRAYLEIGWRDADGSGGWTGHSLRHVFCTAGDGAAP